MKDYGSRSKEIGKRIKKLRTEAGYTEAELLVKLNRSKTSTKMLRAWENGERVPYLEDLVMMADIFDCDISYLLGDCDCKRYITADVKEQTGLTEKTIENLKVLNKNGQLKWINYFLDDLIDYQLLIGLAIYYYEYKNNPKNEYYTVLDEKQNHVTTLFDVPYMVVQDAFASFLKEYSEYSRTADREECRKWSSEDRADYPGNIEAEINMGK